MGNSSMTPHRPKKGWGEFQVCNASMVVCQQVENAKKSGSQPSADLIRNAQELRAQKYWYIDWESMSMDTIRYEKGVYYAGYSGDIAYRSYSAFKQKCASQRVDNFAKDSRAAQHLKNILGGNEYVPDVQFSSASEYLEWFRDQMDKQGVTELMCANWGRRRLPADKMFPADSRGLRLQSNIDLSFLK